MEELIWVLEKSVARHGSDTTVTLGHLLNIARYAESVKDAKVHQREAVHDQIMREIDPFGQG